MNELETDLYALMSAVEADKVNGGNEDDPRIERVGEILTLLEVFHWEDYKRIVIAKFNVPPDHFEDQANAQFFGQKIWRVATVQCRWQGL